MDCRGPRDDRGGGIAVILLDEARLGERRQLVAPGGPLAPLFESLAGELRPLLAAAPHVPRDKALLSRAGGRCDRCGVPLAFDPWSPERHRCDRCGSEFAGPLHHRAWILPYQLWLAERVLHAALFNLLHEDAAHAAFARDTLRTYSDVYLQLPNRDNVLGPTRLFFSTYLESIWLLQVCLAADFLERAGDRSTPELVRDRIVEPSRALVAEYDEGMSNRQVWNNAALLAAARLLGDAATSDTVVHGGSGLLAHLSRALLADGTWYEGENYHQFALRGLWYGVTMLEAGGEALPSVLRDRFQRAFATPFITALPDFTMPSRKDSQYAVALRQWRMAELTELGFARARDPMLAGALARIYDGSIERADTGRSRSTADVERNGPRTALTRSDLGWRALLHALPVLPALQPHEPRSAMLEGQGYAVFRRENGVYVGVECGQSGGGHGHPDRLNLTLYQGATRWLDDMGTGSYVDPSLHWFRSTLAHNAPLVNGKSQPLRDATLLAYDEREGMGWIVAELLLPDDDVRLERAVVVAPDYLVDELRWNAESDVTVDLPWHLPLVQYTPTDPAALDGGGLPADGFAYLEQVTTARDQQLPPLFASDGGSLLVFPEPGPEHRRLFFAMAPGQPPQERRPLAVLRMEGRAGTLRTVVAWGQVSVEAGRVRCGDDEYHTHRRDARGWHVEIVAGHARSTIDLDGFRTPEAPVARPAVRSTAQPLRVHTVQPLHGWLGDSPAEYSGAWLRMELGEAHYRRSEQSWQEAGAPRASVAMAATSAGLLIDVVVHAGDPRFSTADAVNPYDNEHPDTMRAGVQLYLREDGMLRGWMLVPEEAGNSVRVRPIAGAGTAPPRASWRLVAGGYEIQAEIPFGEHAARGGLAVDVVVNETTAERERRRGQLVLSGGAGEFVYLRGDRHDPDRLLPLVIVP